MARSDELLTRILERRSDAAIPFSTLQRLLCSPGFTERVRGSHHIFTKDGVEEILNLQPRGRHAKPYQVRQVRGVILRYRLGGENDGEAEA